MVLFGELCAWEMPEAARTWMKGLEKDDCWELVGVEGFPRQQEGEPFGGHLREAVCLGLGAGNQRTFFGFQLFPKVAQPSDDH